MTAKDLIEKLQRIVDTHGNLEVTYDTDLGWSRIDEVDVYHDKVDRSGAPPSEFIGLV